MNLTSLGGFCAVAVRVQIACLILCSAEMASASSAGSLQGGVPRSYKVDKNDFKLPHGEPLNRVRFLTDGARTVEIPAGSLLHLPLEGRIKIAHSPIGEIVDWKDFLQINSDLISQVGAGKEQLRGNRGIHRAVFAHLERSGKVGVSIAAGRPVGLPQPS